MWKNIQQDEIFLLQGKKNTTKKVCKVTILFSYKRRSKEKSTPQSCSTSTRPVISCTILRNYLTILGPLSANFGVYITRSAIIATLISINVPNDSNVAGYGQNSYKPITILPIFGDKFLHLLPCSNLMYNKNIYITTNNAYIFITRIPDNSCVSR